MVQETDANFQRKFKCDNGNFKKRLDFPEKARKERINY